MCCDRCSSGGGDDRFAGVLGRESLTTQYAVSKDIAFAVRPGDVKKYPRSLALAVQP